MKLSLNTLALAFALLVAISCSDDSSKNDTAPDGGETPDGGNDSGVDEYDYGPYSQQVDQFFGQGPDQEARLEMFDALWQDLADTYGAFATNDVDWDALREEYRPQVEQAESLGRLFALFSELFYALQDSHTTLDSADVCDHTPSFLATRPPVFQVEDMTAAIGVCATPLSDDTMLVYRADDNNPGGLEPGDILLGYDGVPWRDLVEDILDWRLPLCGHFSPNADSHDRKLMGSIVNNAHLFEELDVLKYGQQSSQIIDTDDLLGYSSAILCSDQIQADPSVPFPWDDWVQADYSGNGAVTWGTLQGTNIGYIYSYLWMGGAEDEFETAVSELMGTDGLIIDYRFNLGGSTVASMGGLAQLFNEDLVDVYKAWERDPSSDDYDAMVPTMPGYYDLDADEGTFYDGPIALLTGPHAVSAGDGTTYMTGLHPNIRRFGRASAGAFGFAGAHWDPDPFEGLFTTKICPGILSDGEDVFLHAAPQTIDNPIWLTPEDAHNGVDTVVEAARTWIESQQP